MLIQNEYCNGGSLQDAIENNRASGTSFPESEIKRILLHLSEGLRSVKHFFLIWGLSAVCFFPKIKFHFCFQVYALE